MLIKIPYTLMEPIRKIHDKLTIYACTYATEKFECKDKPRHY